MPYVYAELFPRSAFNEIQSGGGRITNGDEREIIGIRFMAEIRKVCESRLARYIYGENVSEMGAERTR